MKTYTGIVQKGDHRGKHLGFPTVNIPLDDKDVSGIYAARVLIREGDFPIMAAAFADPSRGVLEAHLLDFSDDLYGLTVSIELHHKIRESKKYDSDEALKAAIRDDVAKVREYFKN